MWTVSNFVEALKIAKNYDSIRQQSQKKNWVPGTEDHDPEKYFPPLFGIPISIKDTFDVEGLPTTFGLINRG